MLKTLRYASSICVLAFGLVVATNAFAQDSGDVLFQIGVPDARSAEFEPGLGDWEKLREERGETVLKYVVGKNVASDWSPMHLSTREFHAKGLRFAFEVEFESPRDYDDAPLYLVVGVVFTHLTEQSLICVSTNGVDSEKIRVPLVCREGQKENRFDSLQEVGQFGNVIIKIPQGAVKKGVNSLKIVLEDGSWLFYDYVALREKPEPLEPLNLLAEMKKDVLKDVDKIVFAIRKPSTDPHWYANFGYYPTFEVDDRPFPPHGGGELRVFDVNSGAVQTLFKDDEGSIRDPAVSYDGKKILFSYLKKGTEHYNLYEIDVDGANLRQVTSGDYDDIEPQYLPDGDFVFCSTRAKRFVQCWLTSVATIFRCKPDGSDIRPLSFNIEQDNTPAVLPNGQIMYTRWEYVDRSQVDYHHLWVMNADGTRQSVLYGNKTPSTVYIDAQPIPESDKIVAIASPGHGLTDHRGAICVINPKLGPDDPDALEFVKKGYAFYDPLAFSEDAFMASSRSALLLISRDGYDQTIYSLPQAEKDAGFQIFEPRQIKAREPEPQIAKLEDSAKTTGTLVLSDIYAGRRMKDVPRGTVKELLVLETLPEPIHYSGGMDQISLNGTFTLERIVGTVPVTPEGAAAMELPAGRSYLFVAMDEQGRAVKRMHSFTSVMAGETTSCIGCHETRVETPGVDFQKHVFEVAGKPIAPKPVEGVPDVYDFPRDIQPLLDKHCLKCHNDERTDGGLDLSSDWGPMFSFSYYNLGIKQIFGDNHNRAVSDFEPYVIGSQASRLYKMICDGHQGVEFSDAELKTLRYWLEVGAPYAGTYAANGSGLIGWYYMNKNTRNDQEWRETKQMEEAIVRRCETCHKPDDPNTVLPRCCSHDVSRGKRHQFFNLSRPDRSKILRAPLAKESGGLGKCQETDANGTTKPVFQSVDDKDYQTILAGVVRGRDYILNESNRFSTEPFVPNPAYVKAMIRYEILPKNFDLKTPIDAYETDRAYWKSFDLKPRK